MLKKKTSYYDDNFGHWEEIEPDDPDVEFAQIVRDDSVKKTCRLCGEEVYLRQAYDKCNSCMEKLERGQEW
tara:strand:- start:3747 stop:3959 length:213 start_codon:yes stop_codon:yes gene_type:complete